MNESFDINRYLALIKPLYWKRQLIGSILLVTFLTTLILYRSYESTFFILTVVIFSTTHRIEFNFMTRQGGLSIFNLLPATNLEKYLALLTKAIIFPLLQILTLFLVVRLITISFPNYSSNPVLRIDQFYVSVLISIILFSQKFILGWTSFGVDFLLTMVLMILLMISDTYLHLYFGRLDNFQIYYFIFFVLFYASILFFTYPQMKRLKTYPIKETVFKI